MSTRTRRWLPLAAAALLAGCAADDERVLPLEPAGGADILTRYVALGNSLTAGVQSGGINDSLQLLAYPVLVARQANVPFFVPLLAKPGCGAPYLQPVLVSQARLGGPNAPPCALRRDAVPPRIINNVAYPGSYVAGAIDNTVDANPPAANVHKTVLLGGRTQVEAMRDADPTFVSAWLGNNETLVPAASGRMDFLVPQAAFEAALDSVVRAIRATDARGAALIAPVNALLVAPRVQPGAYFFALRQAGALPKPVALSCAPGTAGGANFVSIDALSDVRVDSIRCTPEAPYVTGGAEIATYVQRVNAYKAAVQQRAQQNDWIFIDPDQAFAADLRDPSKFRKCQGFLALTPTSTPADFAQAVATTCPGPTAPNFFGSFVSFDATHVSSAAQVALANALIVSINQKYGTTIPTI